MGELNEIASQQVEKFCKMGVDTGSGASWQETVRNASAFDAQ
jgi:hypothetical protein